MLSENNKIKLYILYDLHSAKNTCMQKDWKENTSKLTVIDARYNYEGLKYFSLNLFFPDFL